MSETKTAADVLRSRAGSGSAWLTSMRADELRALADLVEALVVPTTRFCLVCLSISGHFERCKLAAVERVFKGEGNGNP